MAVSRTALTSWLKDPVTKELINAIEINVQAVAKQLIDLNHFNPENADVTLQKTLMATGRARGMADISLAVQSGNFVKVTEE